MKLFMTSPLCKSTLKMSSLMNGDDMRRLVLHDLCVALTCGLKAMNENGIVNRDLKPLNIFDKKVFEFTRLWKPTAESNIVTELLKYMDHLEFTLQQPTKCWAVSGLDQKQAKVKDMRLLPGARVLLFQYLENPTEAARYNRWTEFQPDLNGNAFQFPDSAKDSQERIKLKITFVDTFQIGDWGTSMLDQFAAKRGGKQATKVKAASPAYDFGVGKDGFIPACCVDALNVGSMMLIFILMSWMKFAEGKRRLNNNIKFDDALLMQALGEFVLTDGNVVSDPFYGFYMINENGQGASEAQTMDPNAQTIFHPHEEYKITNLLWVLFKIYHKEGLVNSNRNRDARLLNEALVNCERDGSGRAILRIKLHFGERGSLHRRSLVALVTILMEKIWTAANWLVGNGYLSMEAFRAVIALLAAHDNDRDKGSEGSKFTENIERVEAALNFLKMRSKIEYSAGTMSTVQPMSFDKMIDELGIEGAIRKNKEFILKAVRDLNAANGMYPSSLATTFRVWVPAQANQHGSGNYRPVNLPAAITIDAFTNDQLRGTFLKIAADSLDIADDRDNRLKIFNHGMPALRDIMQKYKENNEAYRANLFAVGNKYRKYITVCQTNRCQK